MWFVHGPSKKVTVPGFECMLLYKGRVTSRATVFCCTEQPGPTAAKCCWFGLVGHPVARLRVYRYPNNGHPSFRPPPTPPVSRPAR